MTLRAHQTQWRIRAHASGTHLTWTRQNASEASQLVNSIKFSGMTCHNDKTGSYVAYPPGAITKIEVRSPMSSR